MKLTPGQGGLLNESLKFVTQQRLMSRLQDRPDNLVETSRQPVIEALWHHWLLSPYYIDAWVPASSWPEDVRATAVSKSSKSGKPTYDDDAMRAWRGRLAVLAAVGSPSKISDRPNNNDVPLISRPRRLDQLPSDVTLLRNLVSAYGTKQTVFDSLKSSFGATMVDSVLSGSSVFKNDELWEAVRSQLGNFTGSGDGSLPVEATIPNGRPFRVHVEVREAAQQVLTKDLPFAKEDGTMPPKFNAFFDQLTQLENSIAGGLKLAAWPGMSAPDTSLLPWGLVMTAVARAYFVELLAGMTFALIPMQLLYWAPSGRGSLSKTHIRVGKKSIRTKELYTAYTGVALWEAWSNENILKHVDKDCNQTEWTGNTYLQRCGAPQLSVLSSGGLGKLAAQSAKEFRDFWSMNAPDSHQAVVLKIGTWRERMDIIPQDIDAAQKDMPPQTPADSPSKGGKGKPKSAAQNGESHSTESVAIAKASAIAERLTKKKWLEIPRLELPGGDDEEPFKTTWHRGAHLHAQVTLFATRWLAQLIGEATGLQPKWRKLRKRKPEKKDDEGKQGNREWYWESTRKRTHELVIGEGSPRWGGNHGSHSEHRDGVTFDITHPSDFVPWLGPEQGLTLGRVFSNTGPVPVTVPTPVLGACSSLVRLQANAPNALYWNDQVEYLFDEKHLARKVTDEWFQAPSSSPLKSDVDEAVKQLWGTSIHGHEVAPDNDALRQNLIGHIALMLSGVQKWVYAGVIQHVYALAIVSRVLGKVSAAQVALQHASQGVEFYYLPTDHYNHWHVVFPTRDSWLKTSSKSASDVAPMKQVIGLWKRLGVNFEPMIRLLNDRSTSSNPDIDADRKSLCQMLNEPPPAMPKAEPSTNTLLDALGEAIVQQAYPDTPPATSPDLVRLRAQGIWVPKWQPVEPDSE